MIRVDVFGSWEWAPAVEDVPDALARRRLVYAVGAQAVMNGRKYAWWRRLDPAEMEARHPVALEWLWGRLAEEIAAEFSRALAEGPK